jgi:thiamine pyrophosphokinase
MRQAVIFTNGRLEKPPDLSLIVQPKSLIIAVDGGIRNCLSLGFQPDILIGDFDSIGKEELVRYQADGLKTIQYPSRKDETDLELALDYVTRLEIRDVVILAGLGSRWDMSMANIMLMAHRDYSGMNIRFLDGFQELFLLKAGENNVILGEPGDTLSLIPLGGDVSGIFTSGLEYPLKNEILQLGTGRGVSNTFTHKQAEISYTQGLLLCVLFKSENPSFP